MVNLKNKNIVLGVTGGIAAYKAVEFARLLIKSGANVQVIMTQNATRFVTPLTFEAISQKPVLLDLFENVTSIQHIENARFADAIIIMPATASTIARLAHGFADDLLSAACLATNSPIFIVPAMNKQMWNNLATQHNMAVLKNRPIHIMDTEFGEQACGDIGYGRMLEPSSVLEKLSDLLSSGSDFRGKKVLITVGSTREPIDAVRYISNHSSGKMGFSLAEAFNQLGAEVTLVCGHVETTLPEGCELVRVQTAQQMCEETLKRVEAFDIFIGAAAVADYRAQEVLNQKMKSDHPEVHLKLIKNPDILAQVAHLSKKPFVIGFALETNDLIENAKKKLINKKLDMIIANLQGEKSPFGSDDNEVIVLTSENRAPVTLARSRKKEIANKIARIVSELMTVRDS